MIGTDQIRKLTLDDEPYMQAMQTGKEDDYVVRIFERLVTNEEHALYGYFKDNQMVSVAGYSIFQHQYGMLGRLRSDQRYVGEGYATAVMNHVVQELEAMPEIKWIGANTQLHNFSALRVLEKLHLPKLRKLHASTLVEPEKFLTTEEPKWKELTELKDKQAWVNSILHEEDLIFPLQCYYPFPVSPALFTNDNLTEWRFFENQEKDRIVIMKIDTKRYRYLHIIYLWDDLFSAKGLHSTIDSALTEYKSIHGDDTYVWLDLTDELYDQLDDKSSFSFQDPWILHGYWK
ncbi:GNAT family N-acetyltransferase [Halalkalibacillus halophilus]|uniref:GNAT family N-acetyltransferase n=1 Tax=Halalkalibacillus halophilus TaxID=392827 RepID=UPI0004140364|nr:GNAT family N-acetyltransferase [Halalkalibacillus halophilus]